MTRLLALLSLTVLLGIGVPAIADELPPGGTFFDDDGMSQEGFIEAIRAEGITYGCNPPLNDLFCPERALTRAEMASLLARTLDLPPAESNPFTDTKDSVHVDAISSLAAGGITRGCNPPDNDLFCPRDQVSRGQMAAFLVRALGYEDGAAPDLFSDDDGSVFEPDINRLAAAGVTVGCGDDTYCPARKLTRAEMAVFLARALDLAPNVPPQRPPPQYPDVGNGRRIIYGNSEQRVWMVDERRQLIDTYLVSGRRGVPRPGTYEVFSKSVYTSAGHDGITMKWMARFAPTRSGLAIGFHAIPRYSNGWPLQTEAELGQFRSAGCVRQADHKARALYEWAPIGTTVIVLP